MVNDSSGEEWTLTAPQNLIIFEFGFTDILRFVFFHVVKA